MTSFIRDFHDVWVDIESAIDDNTTLIQEFPLFRDYYVGKVSYEDILIVVRNLVVGPANYPVWPSITAATEDLIETLSKRGDPRKSFIYRYFSKEDAIIGCSIGVLLMASAYRISKSMKGDNYTFLSTIGDIYGKFTEYGIVTAE